MQIEEATGEVVIEDDVDDTLTPDQDLETMKEDKEEDDLAIIEVKVKAVDHIVREKKKQSIE